jgi:preprotein translocase subunit SecE
LRPASNFRLEASSGLLWEAEAKMATKTTKSDNAKTAGIQEKIEAARNYFEESKAEIKKVTWPTRAEVRVTTLAVLILVAVMSIFLGLVDFGLVHLVRAITSLGM